MFYLMCANKTNVFFSLSCFFAKVNTQRAPVVPKPRPVICVQFGPVPNHVLKASLLCKSEKEDSQETEMEERPYYVTQTVPKKGGCSP